VAIDSGSQTNVDYIELLNPAGINANGTTTITGGGGDDRIFIDAVAGPTTVAESPGAERIYVASNASRALFTVGSSSPSSQVLQLTGTPTAGEVYQLTLNGVTAANATTFNASSVTGNFAANTINVGAGSGLTAGSHVTYTTPSQTFTPAAVNNEVTFTPAAVNSNNTITLDGHGFATGEALLYQATTPLPLASGGTLQPGSIYYAISVDANTFELADSQSDALAGIALQFAPPVTGSNDQTLTAVNTITLAGHGFDGFATGEALLYQATTPLPLAKGGTLQPGTIYYAIRVDANTFELADSNADAHAGNALQLASPVTGSNDQTLTAVPVGGLTSGTTYDVLVPDSTNHPNLIQLAAPGSGTAIALTPSTDSGDLGVRIRLSRVSLDPAVTTVGVSAVTGDLTANTINVGAGSGLTAGEVVTYTTPTRTFTPAAVNSDNTTITLARHGFTTGEALIYQPAAGATPLDLVTPNDANNSSALTAGQTYYAIRVNADTFELAATYADATAAVPVPLQFAAPITAVGDQTLAVAPVGGLVNGTTYAVIVPDPSKPTLIQLANTGTPTTPIQLTPSVTAADLSVTNSLSQVASYAYTVPGSKTITAASADGNITVTAHGFVTGEALVYQAPTADELPLAGGGALQSGTTYYAIVVDPNTIELATSPGNATAGVALQFASGVSVMGVQTLAPAVSLRDVATALAALINSPSSPIPGYSASIGAGGRALIISRTDGQSFTATPALTGTTGTFISLGTGNDGYYDDNAINPLDVLAGSLTNMGDLTIDTGAGGNGGTTDEIFISAAGGTADLTGTMTSDASTSTITITGLGITNANGINVNTTGGGASLALQLGNGTNNLTVTGVSANVAAFVYGGTGANTVNVGTAASHDLSQIDGILGVFGTGGNNTLNVYGDASSQAGQLTAIGISGMGMGTNTTLRSVHNDVFGAGFNSNSGVDPAVVYYAERGIQDGIETITSSVQQVNVYLDAGTQSFNVDSAYGSGTTSIYAGTGSDTITVGATESGLHPAQAEDVAFVAGALNIQGTPSTTLVSGAVLAATATPSVTLTDSTQNWIADQWMGDQIQITSGADAGDIETIASNTATTLTLANNWRFATPSANDTYKITSGTTVIVDASGGDFSFASRIGQLQNKLQNNTVTGLGMAGSIAMSQVANAEIDLGPYGNTFYVPSTVAGTSTVIYAGAGFNTVYLGTAEGSAGTGSLAALQGSLTLSGQPKIGPPALAGNEIAFDDQSDTTGQAWTVSNTGASVQPDTTTVTSTGMPVPVTFQRFETVVLNGGQGDNTFDVFGTQREQGSNGGHSSTFTINTGGGNNTVNIGTPSGAAGDLLESFLIDTTKSSGGVPVMVNGQGGNDIVQFMDTASMTDTNLAFVTQQFTDIFPNAATVPTVTATQLTEPAGANEQYHLSDTATGGTFNLTISGVPGQQPFVVQSIPYNVSAATLALMIEDAATVFDASGNPTQEVTVNVTNARDSFAPTSWTIEFTSPTSGITLTADGSNLTSPEQLTPPTGGLASQTGPNFSPPAQTYLSQFSQIFGAPADATPYNTVALSKQATVTVFPPTTSGGGNEQFTVTDENADPNVDPTGGTFALTISGVPNQAPFVVQGIPYNASADALKALITQATFVPGAINVMTQEVTTNVTGDSTTGWTIEFISPNSGITLTADASGLITPSAALNVHTRGIQTVAASLGSGNNVVQLTGPTAYNIIVNGDPTGTKPLNFNVSRSFDNSNGNGGFYSAVLNGGGGSNTLFSNYANGVPNAKASLTFNGGTNGNNTLRIQGDGVASGTYTPSVTQDDAGLVNVNNDLFTFGNTQKLIVHGLSQLTDVTPSNASADLNVNSTAVANLNLPNLVLHQVTVQGVVTWTQQQTSTPQPAQQALHLGKVSAMSADGNTLVVGADLKDPSSNISTLDTYGAVFVYTWNSTTSDWVQQAQLEPGDLAGGGGGGFGDALAISPDGTTIVVGSPGDVGGGANAGAVYLFGLVSGSWIQTTKLKASDMAASAEFGASVSISGSSASGFTLFVGASHAASGSGEAYAFSSANGSAWMQQQKLTAPPAAVQFGDAVAVSGNLAVVGAGGSASNGAAYVYQFTNSIRSRWTPVATLIPSDTRTGDMFGAAVAIDGNLVVVGDPNGNAPVPTEYQTTQPSFVNAGEAFVFNLTTARTPVLEARLTETDGLPIADASAVGQQPGNELVGDQFGAAVAIAGDVTAGYYVVVGAPGYKNNTGAAYAFYRLPDLPVSGNGPSWTRSSGSSGSGQLTPAAPQEAQQEGNVTLLAGMFGGSVVVGGVSGSGGRIVVGMEGYNQTNSANVITAANAGAVRTYTTGGLNALPSATGSSPDAEILDGPQGKTTFGQDTVYDASTHMLFVSAPGAFGSGAVYVYVNQGLYWSFLTTLTAPSNDFYVQFGYALAASGNTLVVGAPSSFSFLGGLVLVYTISGNTISGPQVITGGDQAFGSSVAVSGAKLVVGSPHETVQYVSKDQPASLGGSRVTLTNSGAAYVYTSSNGLWGTSPSALLMPDDNALPESWRSVWSAWTQYFSDSTVLWTYAFPFGWSDWNGSTSDSNYQEINGHPHLHNPPYDGKNSGPGIAGPGGSYDEVQIEETVTALDTTLNDAARGRSLVATANTFGGLNNANFGTSVSIVGNTVVVGAAGLSRLAVYDLDPSTNFINVPFWTAYGSEASGGMTPLRSASYKTVTAGFGLGTVVALQGTGEVFAGAPGAFSKAGAVYAFSINGYQLSLPVFFSSGTGVTGSIAVGGNQEIIGSPSFNSGVGNALLYTSTSVTTANATLAPFKFDSNHSTETGETAGVQFGVGASLISNGFFVVGGTNTATVNSGNGALDSGLLYDFRQRGPAWTPVAQTVNLNSFQANNTFTLQFSAAVVNGQHPITTGTTGSITVSSSTSITASNIANALNTLIGTFSKLSGGPDPLTASVSFVSGQTYAVSFTGALANNVMPLVVGQVVSAGGTAQTTSDVLTTSKNPLAQAGSSVAISGDTLVAGAPQYNNSGAVFVYDYDSSTHQWVVQPAPLQPNDLQTFANFGSSVALDGNTLVVGADNKANGAGAVYVFQNVGGVWTQVAEFQGQAGAHLGTSVGVSGPEVIAGALGSNKAYVYDFNGTAWVSQQTLFAPVSAGSSSGFGGAVAIDGSTAVVGAPDANNVGAAFVYALSGGTWTQQASLGNLVSPPATGGFGSAVAVSGGEVIVGAPDTGAAGSANAGGAYMFKLDSGAWSVDGPALQDLLSLSAGDHFGTSVAIDGQQVMVGAYGADTDRGTAYSFSLNNGFWGLDSTSGLLPGGAQKGDMVGYAVALSGSNAVLGAPQLNGRTPDHGSGAEVTFTVGSGGALQAITTTPAAGGAGYPANATFDLSVAGGGGTGGVVLATTNAQGQVISFAATPVQAGSGYSVTTGAATATIAAINTDGNGYAYIRNLSPPITVTVPERQETLIQGAQANWIGGTVGGMNTAKLYFFDTPTVSVETNASTDSSVTISQAGLTAFGLLNFSVNNTGTGNDTLNVNSNTLAAPAGGSFAPPLSFNPSSVVLNSGTVVYPASATTPNTPNSIAFASADGFYQGEEVTYVSNLGAADTSGLTSGSTYYVNVIDPQTIQLSTTPGGANLVQLGASPWSAGINMLEPTNVTSNQITFPEQDNLITGQLVEYHAGTTNGIANSPIGGLTDGGVYYVTVVNPTTIELSLTLGGPAINDLDPTQATGTGHFFDTRVEELAINTSSAVANNEISFAQPDNLVDQQTVVYHAGSTNGTPNTPIGGLTDGATYIVHVINPTTIELYSGELPINTSSAVANNEISFAQLDNLVDQQTVVYHAGSTNGTPNTPIGGLTDGTTYYVIVVNPTTIELSLTAGGTPITLDPTQATGTGHFLSAAVPTIPLDPTQATGTGQFLSAEVVLRGVFSYGGTGSNTLNVDPDNTDWTLSPTGLTDPQGNQLKLMNVTTVTLTGGAGSNTFTDDGWNQGTLNIHGGLGGSNTYNIDTVNGAADVNVVDPNGTGQLNIFGDPTQKNQFTIGTNAVVWNAAQTISYTGIQTLTVTGQAMGDSFLEEDSSAATVNLDGVSGSNTFQVLQGTTSNTHVIVHGSEGDNLYLPTAMPSTTMLNTFDLGNNETVTCDPAITLNSIAALTANATIDIGANAAVVLQGKSMTINRIVYDLSNVIHLTLDSQSFGGTSYTIDSLLSTLQSLTLTGDTADDNSLIGPSTGTNVWQITGTNSGLLRIGDSSTPAITFSGMANLTGRSSADDFEFENNGTSQTGNLTGNLTGDGGKLDDSGVSAIEELPISTSSAVANNEISFAQPDDLIDQQTVVYHAGSTNGMPNMPIGGLTDGATYYVIVVDPMTIELSLTAGGMPITLDPNQATGTGHFLSAAAVTVNLGAGTATDIGGTLSGITTFKGNAAVSNILVGPNAVNTWQVPTTDSGTLSSPSSSTTYTFTGFSTLAGGDDADTFNVGRNQSTSGITGTLTIIGGSGTNQLIVDDSGSTSAEAAIITSSSITGLSGAGTIDYSATGNFTDLLNADGILIKGGSAGGTYAIQSTLAGSTTEVVGGAGNNTFTVTSATGGLTSGIAGQLTINAGSGMANRLIVDDSGSTSTDAATVTSTSITGLAPAVIDYSAAGSFTDGAVNDGILLIGPAIGGNTFNIQSTRAGSSTEVQTTGASNTINVSSTAPTTGGIVDDQIQGTLDVAGGGSDTLFVDDTGNAAPTTGTLTSTSLTGLGMGGAGILYAGLAELVVHLGSGGPTSPGGPVGNSFTVNGVDPLTHTQIDGGSSNNNTVDVNLANDFDGQLDLTAFQDGSVTVNGNFNGVLNDTLPGHLESVQIGGDLAGTITVSGTVSTLSVGKSVTPTASLTFGNLDSFTVGPDSLFVNDNFAGELTVNGTLGAMRVAGGTPGTIVADQIGTIAAFGGYGPVALRVIENGIERHVELTTPADPYPQPDPTALATSAGAPSVNLQYFYESGTLANPQLTARLDNGIGTAPDQYDVSLVTYNDAAKFNLARLDAVVGTAAEVRNVAVEGDVLTAVSSQASAFFTTTGANNTVIVDSTPAGIRLPLDHLAGVAVRDYLPGALEKIAGRMQRVAYVQAATIQALAFGSFTGPKGQIQIGASATPTQAAALLVRGTKIAQAMETFPGTAIAPAMETYRVPFADLLPVGLFLSTSKGGGSFDVANIAFAVEGVTNPDHTGTVNVITPSNVARGAVVALVTVVPTFSSRGKLRNSVVQSIALRGDGGSIRTEQTISGSITSTGLLGDLILQPNLAQPGVAAILANLPLFGQQLTAAVLLSGVQPLLPNITAPAIFGSIVSGGVLTGIVQTTGQRTDPITGAVSVVPADLGGLYVVQLRHKKATVFVINSTVVEVAGISGKLVSRGDLISQVILNGGALSGVVAAQGNLGAIFTSSSGQVTHLGGLATAGTVSGAVVVLGQILGDISIGGVLRGRIAANDGILSNLKIDSGINKTGAIVSGGEIGDTGLGTTLTINGGNQGILAAVGVITFAHKPVHGHVFNDVGATPSDPIMAADTAKIKAIFQPLAFDIGLLDLAGLNLIRANLAALEVDSNGNLT
jgi:hypothetical protein